jgi:hypothetical protein
MWEGGIERRREGGIERRREGGRDREERRLRNRSKSRSRRKRKENKRETEVERKETRRGGVMGGGCIRNSRERGGTYAHERKRRVSMNKICIHTHPHM